MFAPLLLALTLAVVAPAQLDDVLAETDRLIATGQHEQAVARLRSERTTHPDALELEANLGLALLAGGRVDEARAMADQLGGGAGDSYRGQLLLGHLAFRARQADAALPHYRRAAELHAEPVDALVGQVNVFRALGKHGKAVKRALTLTEISPATGRRLHAEVLVDQGDKLMAMGPELLTTAAARYQAALKLQPSDRVMLSRLLDAMVTAARVDDAERIAASALVAEEDRAELLYWRGRSREAAREFDAARVHYQASIALRPEHGETLLHLARLAVADRRLDEARTWLDGASQQMDTSPRMLLLEAEVHVGLADLPAAEACLTQALKLSPSHSAALYQYARVLLLSGRREEGLAAMTHFRDVQKGIMAAQVVEGR